MLQYKHGIENIILLPRRCTVGRTGRSPGLSGGDRRSDGEQGNAGALYYSRTAVCRSSVVLSHTFSMFSTNANMSADVMTSKFGNITLKTSTPKKDAEDEDVAVLSSFLPDYLMSPAAITKNKMFECSLKRDCRLGDPKSTPPGQLFCVRVSL